MRTGGQTLLPNKDKQGQRKCLFCGACDGVDSFQVYE